MFLIICFSLKLLIDVFVLLFIKNLTFLSILKPGQTCKRLTNGKEYCLTNKIPVIECKKPTVATTTTTPAPKAAAVPPPPPPPPPPEVPIFVEAPIVEIPPELEKLMVETPPAEVLPIPPQDSSQDPPPVLPQQ